MKYFDLETAKHLKAFDFDDLVILALLYDNHTGTECGVILNITQPAVSQRMKKMTAVLSFPIFNPDGKRVVLTPKGRVLASACKVAIKIITESISLR